MIENDGKNYIVAKKDHVCDLCGNSILYGTKYVKTEILYNRSVKTLKHHEECSNVSDKILPWATHFFKYQNFNEHTFRFTIEEFLKTYLKYEPSYLLKIKDTYLLSKTVANFLHDKELTEPKETIQFLWDIKREGEN